MTVLVFLLLLLLLSASDARKADECGIASHIHKRGATQVVVMHPDLLKKRENKRPKKWDRWGKWSTCSVTCGAGKITRWRHCVGGGCAPGEKEAQIKTCTQNPC